MSIDLQPADFSIHIVDDETPVRNFLLDAFKKWGFQVRAFADGDSCLEAMKKNDLPHILFADIEMEGLSGIGLAKRAKDLSKEIEVVFMTATPTMDSALEALRLGVHDYLLKPFENLDDVKNVIFHVCERIYLRLYNEYLVSELKIKNEEIRGLSFMADELTDIIDVSKTIEVGCRHLSKAFKGADVCFLQFLPKDMSLTIAARFPEGLFGGAQSKLLIPNEFATDMPTILEFLKNIEKDEKFSELLVNSSRMTPGGDSKTGWRSFPFITRGLPRGIFAIHVPDWDDEIQRGLGQRYLQALEKYFENALLHKRVFEMSVRDGLTGLYNVRTFKERVEQELKVAERIEHPLCVVFFDVDHFKNYNDNNGHLAGDYVLRTFAELLTKNFRATDFIARYGGEEFCILLPHTRLESALAKVESFRKVVEGFPFQHGETQPMGKITVSVGVSEFPTHAATYENLVKLADEALYRAKAKSRNCVMAAEKDPAYYPPFESRHVTIAR